MSKTPSAILSDALASFNRSAALALSAAQEFGRKDFAQATEDTREARRERDEAVKALHALTLEEQAWKQEAGVWKATAEQAELTINHHLETIAQLRQEATQWKNQCLRLEETSRQEAISWKEQFLRVEQERSKLAQRLEELLAEQLGSNAHVQTTATPYTPMPRHPGMCDLSTSVRPQGASSFDSSSPRLQERVQSKAVALKTCRRPAPNLQLPTPLSENQRSRQRGTQGTVAPISLPGNGPRQILVRRVHAVVDVPVKEESVESEGVGLERISTSPSHINTVSTSTSTCTSASKVSETSKAMPRVKRRASTKRSYVEIDEESEREDAHASRQGDVEEYQSVSDDDDELLMGVETNRKEVYGMKRVPKPVSFSKSSYPLIVAKKRKAAPPAKKSRPSTASMS